MASGELSYYFTTTIAIIYFLQTGWGRGNKRKGKDQAMHHLLSSCVCLQIVECRRVLKWTYSYGFYLPEHEHAKRQFFEYLQGMHLINHLPNDCMRQVANGLTTRPHASLHMRVAGYMVVGPT